MPMAWRTMDRTTEILTKDVIMMRTNGASEMAAITNIRFNGWSGLSLPAAWAGDTA